MNKTSSSKWFSLFFFFIKKICIIKEPVQNYTENIIGKSGSLKMKMAKLNF